MEETAEIQHELDHNGFYMIDAKIETVAKAVIKSVTKIMKT